MPLGVGALFFIYVPTDMLRREYLIYCRHCITDTGAGINYAVCLCPVCFDSVRVINAPVFLPGVFNGYIKGYIKLITRTVLTRFGLFSYLP